MSRRKLTARRSTLMDFEPAPYNPRTISDRALAGLSESLMVFGDLSGFVVNRTTGHVICGHQRRVALSALDLGAIVWSPAYTLELGFDSARFTSEERKGEISTPSGARFTVREVRWPQAFERAANIAANNPAIQGEWVNDKLNEVLAQIRRETPQAIDALYLETLLASASPIDPAAGLTDPDAVPAPPDAALTQPGDLWLLGNHRLLCGDSGKAEDLDRLLAGARIDLLNMDPPYNVKVEPRSNNAIAAGLSSALSGGKPAIKIDARRVMHHQSFDLARGRSKARATTRQLRPKDRPLVNDFLKPEEFAACLRAWFGQAARALRPGGAFYIWGGYANCANYPPALVESGLYFSQAIIWVKEWPVLTRKDFMGNHEWCFYGWREGAGHWFNPEIKNATDVWRVRKVSHQDMVHLTEKPVELAQLAMLYSSKPGAKVLDLFGGSGSTLIAAEQTGRSAYLVELDQLYCDVIVKRWQAFTGRRAERVDARGKRKKGLAA